MFVSKLLIQASNDARNKFLEEVIIFRLTYRIFQDDKKKIKNFVKVKVNEPYGNWTMKYWSLFSSCLSSCRRRRVKLQRF